MTLNKSQFWQNKSLSKTVDLSIDLYCWGRTFFVLAKKLEIFIQSIYVDAWNPIVEGPFIPIKEVNGELVPIEWDDMKDDGERKVPHDQKAKSILTSSLSSD